MKILFVLEHYHPYIGGAEVLFRNLCEGLAARGHIVTVLTSQLPGTPLFEIINGVSVRRIRLPSRGRRYWFTFAAIFQAIRLAGQADILHTTTYNGAFPAWLAGKLTGKKCLITVHEVIGNGWIHFMGMGPLMSRVHRMLERIIITLPFSKYACVSKYTAGELQKRGIKPARIAVIYNGIDYELFNPRKYDKSAARDRLGLKHEFVYMYYGRPGISKGVEYLVQSVPIVQTSAPDARLLIILAREPAEGYRRVTRLFKELNLAGQIIMLDAVPRNDLPNYIAAADCVVVPSLSEGFGFSAAEACAMGKPVVSSNAASLPEIVSGRYILVDAGNPQKIAEAIVRMYRGDCPETPGKQFLWSSCIEGYAKIYHQYVPST